MNGFRVVVRALATNTRILPCRTRLNGRFLRRPEPCAAALAPPANALITLPHRAAGRAFLNCLTPRAAALALLLISGGCLFQKKPVVQAPVAMPPAPAPAAASPSPTAAPAPAPPAPHPTAAAASTTPAAAEPAKPSPFPPVPATVPVKPKPVTPPAPVLGTILSADQRKKLDIAYQSDLSQANALLAKLNGRTLTTTQNDSVTRARAFIRQAAQFHDRDLTTAAELAHRARVLTQDLAGALK